MSALRSVILQALFGVFVALGLTAGVSAQVPQRFELMQQGIGYPYVWRAKIFTPSGQWIWVDCFGYDTRGVCYVTPEMAAALQSYGVMVYVPQPPPVIVVPPPIIVQPPPPNIFDILRYRNMERERRLERQREEEERRRREEEHRRDRDRHDHHR